MSDINVNIAHEESADMPRNQAEFNNYVATKLRTFQTQLDDNTSMTAEVVEILRNARAFFKLVNVAGRLLKWFASIVAALFVLWRAYKFLKG